MGRQTLLEALAERESMFRMLPQTTPENTSKNFGAYTVDPVGFDRYQILLTIPTSNYIF